MYVFSAAEDMFMRYTRADMLEERPRVTPLHFVGTGGLYQVTKIYLMRVKPLIMKKVPSKIISMFTQDEWDQLDVTQCLIAIMYGLHRHLDVESPDAAHHILDAIKGGPRTDF